MKDINNDWKDGFPEDVEEYSDITKLTDVDIETKRLLTLFINPTGFNDIDLTHTCLKTKCNPRNIIYFSKHNTKCNEDIFLCNLGKFHDCSDTLCVGNVSDLSNCTCLKTAKNKGYNVTSFEVHQKSYMERNAPFDLKTRDNWKDIHSRSQIYSVRRDDLLNKETKDEINSKNIKPVDCNIKKLK